MATSPHHRRNPRRNRLRPYIWGGAAALLLLPALAMQFTREVDWNAFDFIVMGAMLAVACGLYELGTWLSGNRTYRTAFGIAVATGFLTIWANLAVGMFGSEDNPINLLFGGVLIVAAVGSLIAKLRASPMAWAMGLTAGTQLLAVAIALVLALTPGREEAQGSDVFYEALLSACFALPWLASSLLFRMAARNAETDSITAPR